MVMPRQVLGVQGRLLEVLLDAEGQVEGRLVKQCAAPVLAMGDFSRWEEQILLAARILEGAVRDGASGVNVLLRDMDEGADVELAGLLARQAGYGLYESVWGSVSTGSTRGRDTHMLVQRMLQVQGQVLHLASLDVVGGDDDDDLPPLVERWRRIRSYGHRGLLKDLKTNPVPTIWVCGQRPMVPEQIQDHFTYVLRTGRLSRGGRARVHAKVLSDLQVSEDLIARIASCDALGPEDLRKAVQTVKLARPEGVQETDRVLLGVLESILAPRGDILPSVEPETGVGRYSLDYLNASLDVHRLVDRLAARPEGRLLLHGPPGTGKTMLATHISTMAGKGLLTRKASDLLGCYVGETEKRIREMFAQATSEDRILLVDEADSFLRERSGAHHSWEVTQVNELLVQMERFGGLFICSTNLTQDLDRACFRRFDVKVRFAHLTSDQARSMYTDMLEDLHLGAPTSTQLQAVGSMHLTPGDFRTVRRHLEILEVEPDASMILELLRAETMEKSTQGVGFVS